MLARALVAARRQRVDRVLDRAGPRLGGIDELERRNLAVAEQTDRLARIVVDQVVDSPSPAWSLD